MKSAQKHITRAYLNYWRCTAYEQDFIFLKHKSALSTLHYLILTQLEFINYTFWRIFHSYYDYILLYFGVFWCILVYSGFMCIAVVLVTLTYVCILSQIMCNCSTKELKRTVPFNVNAVWIFFDPFPCALHHIAIECYAQRTTSRFSLLYATTAVSESEY